MALVSRMGEAVPACGDGIASESKGQDGVVFAGKTRDVLVKEVRVENVPLNSCRCSGVIRNEPRGHEGRLDAEIHQTDIANLANGPALVHSSPSMNGKMDGTEIAEQRTSLHYVNGLESRKMVGLTNGEAEKMQMEMYASGSSSGCSDRLVELAIECLDEKVRAAWGS